MLMFFPVRIDYGARCSGSTTATKPGRGTVREVRPLGLWFWGKVWTLIAWCEMRGDFRAFRIDRIASVVCTDRKFKPEKGKLLADFYRTMERGGEAYPGRAQSLEAQFGEMPYFRQLQKD